MAKRNNADAERKLDSSSSGLLINRKVAEKAGWRATAPHEVMGLADERPQKGFPAYADRNRARNLEFHDCLIEVSDRKYVAGSDGLIGTDIFSDFVVSIDFPLHSLELSRRPSRPGEPSPGASLRTGTTLPQNPSADAHPEAAESKDSNPSEQKSASSAVKQAVTGPKGRSIAPEMRNWFAVFRVGHDRIVRGLIDKNYSKLFLIDAGSEATILPEDAASETRRS
jgi:hypothetical protein